MQPYNSYTDLTDWASDRWNETCYSCVPLKELDQFKKRTATLQGSVEKAVRVTIVIIFIPVETEAEICLKHHHVEK